MRIKNGCTRKVFLVGKYAIKIPQISYQWKHFLLGLLANMQEKHFSTMKDERMCPVIFCTYGGWVLIMPRCRVLTEEEHDILNTSEFTKNEPFTVPVETNKPCSFGWYKDKIVAIDYGS